MPGFILRTLYNRLDNEERLLRRLPFAEVLSKEDTCDLETDTCRKVTLETIFGVETLTVARIYRIRINARGYERTSAGEIIPRNTHEFLLYILRSYPFPIPSKKTKGGAPIRIVWLTPIFHPNIMPGLEGGGKGVVCWGVLQQWLPTMTLKDIVTGIKNLVEHPNIYDAILSPETKEAAEWFRRRGEV